MALVKTSAFMPLAGIGIRTLKAEAVGDEAPIHYHNFHHTFFCTAGRWLGQILSDDERTVEREREVGAGEYFVVEATKRHRFIALTDNAEGHCVFAHRTPQGEVVQDYNGWDEASTNRTTPPTEETLNALARGEDTHGHAGN